MLERRNSTSSRRSRRKSARKLDVNVDISSSFPVIRSGQNFDWDDDDDSFASGEEIFSETALDLISGFGRTRSESSAVDSSPDIRSIPPKSPLLSSLERRGLLPTGSHYKQVFQEISKQGAGGFGVVYKVRNRLDSRVYAVKKVSLHGLDDSMPEKVNES